MLFWSSLWIRLLSGTGWCYRQPSSSKILCIPGHSRDIKLFRPGLDNTRLFISLTAGAGTRCCSQLTFMNAFPWNSDEPPLTAEPERFQDLMPGGYIPRLEIMERECWKFLDWRLNSDNDSRLHGQPSSSKICRQPSSSSSLTYRTVSLLLFRRVQRDISSLRDRTIG